MLAGSDNTSEELLKEFGNFRVLRSAIIYGANGSGKSNFINALAFMCVWLITVLIISLDRRFFRRVIN